MRSLAILFLASLALSAGPILVGPIPLTGSGSFSSGPGLSQEYTLSAGGSNGTDSFSISVDIGVDPGFIGGTAAPPPSLIDFTCFYSGFVLIDGISAQGACLPHNNVAFWSIGSEGSSAEISFSPAGGFPGSTPVIEAELRGYLQYTNVQEVFRGPILESVQADFVIVPTPDAPTWSLFLIGLGSLATWAWRR